MMSEETRERLVDRYGMPPGRLMYHFYVEREMSAGDIADELDESRDTVKYWLSQSGIEMRSRKLSDVQRLLIMAYIDAGIGDKAISRRVRCGPVTVKRYRQDMRESLEPIGLNGWISSEDMDILESIIEDAFPEGKQSSSV